MNTQATLFLFLGRLQERIEDLSALANDTQNPLFNLLSELEHYFNKSIHEILSQDEVDISRWSKEITWNTLPR